MGLAWMCVYDQVRREQSKNTMRLPYDISDIDRAIGEGTLSLAVNSSLCVFRRRPRCVSALVGSSCDILHRSKLPELFLL
jgi:hypothetical protein